MIRRVLLVGAGGHAKVLNDMLALLGWSIASYVDPKTANWLNCTRYESDDAALEDRLNDSFAIGMGGMTPQALESRSLLAGRYAAFKAAPAVIDPRAIVSTSARVSDSAQVFVGSVVNADAYLGEASIVNTCAIVEHEASIGAGTHVAPGAIVLGGATVGNFCMIGAGAIVLPGVRVPDRTLVAAGSVFRK